MESLSCITNVIVDALLNYALTSLIAAKSRVTSHIFESTIYIPTDLKQLCKQRRRMDFLMVTTQGALGLGRFPCPPWHKQERENILKSVGLKVEHGDQIEYGESRGAFKTVGDQEHLDIIDDYFEGSSMGKIAKKLDRSAATVHAQIYSHNEDIDKQGYCTECRRLKGTHEGNKTDSRAA